MPDDIDYRSRILEKAANKFFALGFARVTMDELAAELGMSKKTLYKYFPAKAELVQAMVLEFIQRVSSEQDRVLGDETIDFEKRISEILKLLAQSIGRIGPLFVRDMQRMAPEVWKTIEEARHQRIQTVFGGLLEEGQRAGFVRRDVHLPFIVHFIATSIRETLNPSVLTEFPLSLAEGFETMRTIFMGGILTELGRDKFLRGAGCPGKTETGSARG